MEWSFSETILLYSRSQIKYYPSTYYMQILIYLVITFSTSTSSFHLTFLWMEILGSISNETREKRNGIIKRNEQKKIPQFYSYAVSIQ